MKCLEQERIKNMAKGWQSEMGTLNTRSEFGLSRTRLDWGINLTLLRSQLL